MASANPVQLAANYPTPKFKFRPITDTEIQNVIMKLGPYKAPGPDGIPNVMLT